MKKVSLIARLTTIALAATLLFISCKKENSDTLSAQEEEQAATYSTEAETETEIAFNDVFDNVMGVNSELGTGGVGIFGRIASQNGRVTGIDSVPRCVAVTIVPQTPGVFPKTVTLDFGSGCLSHGHLRSGKIKTVYSGRLNEPAYTRLVAEKIAFLSNCSIDEIAILITQNAKNLFGIKENH